MEIKNKFFLLRKTEETQKELDDLIADIFEKTQKKPERLLKIQKKLLIIHT
jgi:hypothetical protein